jgi:hypothetical protein
MKFPRIDNGLNNGLQLSTKFKEPSAFNVRKTGNPVMSAAAQVRDTYLIILSRSGNTLTVS